MRKRERVIITLRTVKRSVRGKLTQKTSKITKKVRNTREKMQASRCTRSYSSAMPSLSKKKKTRLIKDTIIMLTINTPIIMVMIVTTKGLELRRSTQTLALSLMMPRRQNMHTRSATSGKVTRCL